MIIMKNTIKYNQLINSIRFVCQVDNFNLYEIENNLYMMFSVKDSDCENCFEEFKIEQKEIDCEYYNIINLSLLINS